jgi:hypothetical protein
VTLARDPSTLGEQAAACVRVDASRAALRRGRERVASDARPLVAPAAVAALVQQQGSAATHDRAAAARGDVEVRKAVLRSLRKLAPEGKT